MKNFFEFRESHKTLDEAKGTGVKKFVKGMRVAKTSNSDMKGTVIKGGDNMKKGVEVEWDSGKTTVASGKYLMSIKKESVELDEAKISVGDRVTLQPNKNTLDRSLIGKAGVVTGMVGSKPTVKFANGKTIAVSPKDLKVNESVELDEAKFNPDVHVKKAMKVLGPTRNSDEGITALKKAFNINDSDAKKLMKATLKHALGEESVQHTSFSLREASYPLAKKWQSGAKVVKKGKVELTRGSSGVHSIKVNGKSVGDFSLDDDSGMWVTNVKGKKGQGTYDEIDDIVNAMMKESVQHTFFSLREARRDAAKDLYFDTYSAAVQTALADVKKKGFEVDEDDWHDSITTGPGKPGRGKTVRHTIGLTKGGKPQRKALHIQVYNRDTDKKTYELNYYVS